MAGGLLDRHAAGKEDLSRQIWGLLMFSLWQEHYKVGSSQSAAGTRQATPGELRTAN